MKGLQLAESYYFDCVRPLIAEHLPALEGRHAAGLLGYGSDVTGNDDELSRDHEWGPRLVLFLEQGDYPRWGEPLDRAISAHLPSTFQGFSTRFKRDPALYNSLVMAPDEQGQHHIAITTAERFLELNLGYPGVPTRDLDWLLIPEQRLLEFTSGAIFADPLQLITPFRQAFAWYPENVWRYRLAFAWECIGWELDLVWLCGRRGDALSMHLNAAKTVERTIRLAFLLSRRYAPGYSKWLEREFRKIPDLPEQLAPLLDQIISSIDYRRISDAMQQALGILYRRQLQLDLFSGLPPIPPLVEKRGFSVVNVQGIARSILAFVEGELRDCVLHGAPIGAVDQWLGQEDILLSPEHMKAMTAVYAQCARRRRQVGDDLI